MKTALAVALLVGLTAGAMAQVPPYIYAPVIGTSSQTILAANTARKRLIFVNPNDTAKVAVCPAGPGRATGGTFTAAINGGGCVTILPYGSFTVDGTNTGGPVLSMPSSWIGIATAPATPFTILEFE